MVNSSFLPVEVHVRIHPRSLPHSSDRRATSRTGLTGKVRLHAVAAAAVLALSLAQPSDALALALGPVQVKSALGEPIRAEIEVPEITAQEASSLQIRLAGAEALRAAGIESSQALVGVEITLQRRSDGRQYLRVVGNRPVNEPFVDLVIEANWATGRLVRDYTLLFDPPNLRAGSTAPAPLPPVAAAPAARPRASAPAAVPAPAPAAAATAPAPSAPRAAAPAPAAAGNGGGQVTVRPGDTAGKIAAANKPASVSLEQMLVAMLQANPQAFIGGNVNRIKAGSVLDLPSAATAQSVDESQARQTIAAQSKDFNEFRRRLAGAAPAAAVASAGQQASGKVQAEVKDTQGAPAPADKLTLTKPGAAGAAPGGEDKIAQARQTQDTQQRTAELNRNIEELAKLATPAASAVPAAAAPAAPAAPAVPATAAVSGIEVPAPAGVPASPAVSAVAPAADAAAPAAAPAPAAPAAPAPAPAAAAPDVGAGGLVDQLRDNPMVLPGAAALLALLAGFGLYRMRQRKARSQVDSSFLESRLQPDSFFGSSGGQRIDTAEAAASGSSMVYSPSQLDAAGDVDPVAEADVYLAYGRDLQAEEILKEALRTSPSRVAIHSKLSEIYAKRRDARAFEVVAAEAFGLTQGRGDEWEEICRRGRDLDPSNPLYQPGGVGSPTMRADGGDPVNTMPFGASSVSAMAGAGSLSAMGNLDVDLDLSLDDDPPVPARASAEPDDLKSLDDALSDMADLSGTESLTAAPAATEPAPLTPVASAAALAPAPAADDMAPLNMEFDIDFTAAAPAAAPAAAEASASNALDLPGFDLDLPPAVEPVAAAAPSASAPAPAPLSFDLGGVSLDLDTPAPAPEETTSAGDLTEENPLETKLSLAEEFRAIGDIEGARSLAEEVMNESSGTLQSKARTFLADLA